MSGINPSGGGGGGGITPAPPESNTSQWAVYPAVTNINANSKNISGAGNISSTGVTTSQININVGAGERLILQSADGSKYYNLNPNVGNDADYGLTIESKDASGNIEDIAIFGSSQSSVGKCLYMDGNPITSCADPTNAQDVATKNYVDNVGAENLEDTLTAGNNANNLGMNNLGDVAITSATASSSSSTGALVVPNGGVGIGGNLNVAGTVTTSQININVGAGERLILQSADGSKYYNLNPNVGNDTDYGLTIESKDVSGDIEVIAIFGSSQSSVGKCLYMNNNPINNISSLQAVDSDLTGTTIFGNDVPNNGDVVDMITKDVGTYLITPKGILFVEPQDNPALIINYFNNTDVRSKTVHTISLTSATLGGVDLQNVINADITVPFEHTFIIENYALVGGDITFSMFTGSAFPGTPYFGIINLSNPTSGVYESDVTIPITAKPVIGAVGRTILRVVYAPKASSSSKSILYIEQLVLTGDLNVTGIITQNSLPLTNIQTYMTNTGVNATNFPTAGDPDDPNVSIWDPADTALVTASGTFNYALHPTAYNQALDVTLSCNNNNASATRSAGIAFQFQNDSDDSWTTSGLPYQFDVVEIKETACIRLVHRLDAGHGYKAFRILVRGESSDVRFGAGNIQRQNSVATIVHSFV